MLFNVENGEEKLEKGGFDPIVSVGSNQKVTAFKHRIGGKNGDSKHKQKNETEKEEEKDDEVEEDNNEQENTHSNYNNTQIARNVQTIGNRFGFQPNYSDQITKDHTNNEMIQFTPQNEDENLLSMRNALEKINKNNHNNNNINDVLPLNSKEIGNHPNLNEQNTKRGFKDSNNVNSNPYDSLPNSIPINKTKQTHQMNTPPIENPEMYRDKRYVNHSAYENIPNDMRYSNNQYYYQEPPKNIITDFYSDPPYTLPPSNEYEYYQYPPMINRPPEISPLPYYRQFPPTLSPSSQDTLKERETNRSRKGFDYYSNTHPNSKTYLSQKTYRKEPMHVEYHESKLIRSQKYQHGCDYQQQQPIPSYYDPNDMDYYESQQRRHEKIHLPQRRPILLSPNYNEKFMSQENTGKGHYVHYHGEKHKKSPQNGKDFLDWLSNSKH